MVYQAILDFRLLETSLKNLHIVLGSAMQFARGMDYLLCLRLKTKLI